MSAILEVKDLAIRYQPRQKDSHLAVDGVTFDVRTGERLAILGPSGCGKTSILMSVAGFLPPSRGQVLCRGTAVQGPGPDRAVVFQDFDQLFPWKSVRKNLEYAIRLALGLDKDEAEARAMSYLELVGIRDAAERFPHQLSGGMKQRAAIARAMAVEPSVLLLDEPFGAVDEITRTGLQRELARICRAESVTVMMVTHSIQEAVYLGDRVMVMSAGPGRVVEIVDTSEVDEFDHPEFAGEVDRLRELLEAGSRKIGAASMEGKVAS